MSRGDSTLSQAHVRNAWTLMNQACLAVVMAVASATLVVVGPPYAAAASGLQPDCSVLQRDSARDAVATAVACGQAIEILGTRSETRREWAQSDRTIRAEVHVGPQWAQDEATGQWQQVDLTLERRPDSSVAPRVHARGLRLSGGTAGGTSELAAVSAGENKVAVGWRGLLPEPILEGAKATYREVRPGIDLVRSGG